MRFCSGVAAPLLFMLLAAGSLHAQRAAPAVAGLSAERLTRERWLLGREQRRFTPFGGARHWARIDSVVAGKVPRGRLFHLRLEDGTRHVATAVLRVGPTGAWLDASARFTEPLPFERALLDTTRASRWRALYTAREVSLLEPRLWGFIPVVRPTRLAPGVRWTDTLNLTAEHGGFRQALRGVRVSVVLADTMVDGRRLWVIRDSARVRYEDRSLEQERTLGATVTIDRTAEGIVRGRHVYDQVLGLFLQRDDTTMLAGEAALRYPDGRSFRTPARYEASGSWTLRDPAAHERRVAEILQQEPRWRGTVVLPIDSLERALARDDPGVRDSLIAVWERTQDPNDYSRLYALLNQWGRGNTGRLLRDRRLAAGDTALLLQMLADKASGYGRQLDIADARLLLSFLENPGVLFALDVPRDPLYEAVIWGLTHPPPAATPDTSEWPCSRDACRFLAEQWHRATEPRLREIGLAALATTDPARWLDTLLADAPRGSGLLGELRATAAIEWPMPAAHWREWRRWMIHDSCLGPSPCRSGVSFSREAAWTMRLHQARGTRDLAGEIAGRFAVEASDSARLVFGVLRLAFDRDTVHPDSVAAHLRSPSEPLRTLGDTELERLFEQRSAPPDSTTLTEILDQYIAATYTASAGWARLPDLMAGRSPVMGPSPDALKPGRFLLSDHLPSKLRRKWQGRVPLISRAEFDARSAREELSVTSVDVDGRVGPFVQVTIDESTHDPGSGGQPPRGSASSRTLFLMKLGGGWVIVAFGRYWIS